MTWPSRNRCPGATDADQEGHGRSSARLVSVEPSSHTAGWWPLTRWRRRRRRWMPRAVLRLHTASGSVAGGWDGRSAAASRLLAPAHALLALARLLAAALGALCRLRDGALGLHASGEGDAATALALLARKLDHRERLLPPFERCCDLRLQRSKGVGASGSGDCGGRRSSGGAAGGGNGGGGCSGGGDDARGRRGGGSGGDLSGVASR